LSFLAVELVGSIFSARLVKPAARKRLEASPEVTCLIEFMGAESQKRDESPTRETA
jgi:hypothetical protein